MQNKRKRCAFLQLKSKAKELRLPVGYLDLDSRICKESYRITVKADLDLDSKVTDTYTYRRGVGE